MMRVVVILKHRIEEQKRKKVCSPNMDENCNGDACKRRMVVVIHNERMEQRQPNAFLLKTPKINENCDGYDSKRRVQIFCNPARSTHHPTTSLHYEGVQFAPICYKAKPPLTVITSNRSVCLLCIFNLLYTACVSHYATYLD